MQVSEVALTAFLHEVRVTQADSANTVFGLREATLLVLQFSRGGLVAASLFIKCVCVYV